MNDQSKNSTTFRSVRCFVATSLIVLAIGSVSGQVSNRDSDPADLEIVKVDLQHTVLRGPSLRAVTSTDPGSQTKARSDRVQDSNSDSLPAIQRMSRDAEIAPKTSKSDPVGNIPSKSPVVFVVSVVVKNVGKKTVRTVEWEYLLFEKGGPEPIKRYRVCTKKLILPNEQAELTKEVTPKGQEQQVRLSRIEYSDGSVWRSK